MKKYRKADITEQELEDLVRRNTEMIEEGLVYIDHQKPAAGGRLDVFMVDSGKSLIVAELKVVQDDGMLLQGLDYYDYVTTHVESFARLYKDQSIDPTQQVRLFLIAPSFSQTLVNRCKWLDVPITLFTFNCLKFDKEDDIVPIFTEQPISAPPEIIEITHLDDHLAYITDTAVRSKVAALLEEIKNWKPGNISLDAIKYAISMKVNGHVFAYLHPRRQHYLISTFNADDEWTEYPIKGDDDLANVKPLIKAAMERRL
ncbi:MAG: hypothetical protein NTW93_00840 [Phycisphaerae bacterium]|nr:hypothetical protein [Phycisphaerae bacterium]